MKRIADYNPHLGHKDDVIPEYMYLAYKVASQYKGYCNHYSVEIGDFVGEAFLGLVRAFDSYDPNKHAVKFQTLVTKCMHNEISRFIRDKMDTVRIPRNIKVELNQRLVMSLNKDNNSLEEPEEYLNLIASEEDISYLYVRPYISKLNDEEKRILALLMEGHKQSDVARMLGCSRQLLLYKMKNIRNKYDEMAVQSS